MNRAQKEQVVAELRDELVQAASIVLTDLTGLDVETVNGLRSNLREKGVRCRVAKNTLIKLAVAGSPVEALNPLLAGPTALIWHDEEPATGAKVLKDFIKDHGDVEFKGGYIDGEILKGKAAAKLADMLSKDELRAQLLGLTKMVPGKFLALLLTAPRKFLAVLLARKADLEEKGEG